MGYDRLDGVEGSVHSLHHFTPDGDANSEVQDLDDEYMLAWLKGADSLAEAEAGEAGTGGDGANGGDGGEGGEGGEAP